MRRHPDYLLSAYLFESISTAGRDEVEAHLSGCGSCRDELEELRRTVAAVRDAFVGPTGEPVSGAGLRAKRIRISFAGFREPVTFGRWIRRLRWKVGRPRAILAVAAGILVTAMLVGVVVPTLMSRKSSQYVTRAPSEAIGSEWAEFEKSIKVSADKARGYFDPAARGQPSLGTTPEGTEESRPESEESASAEVDFESVSVDLDARGGASGPESTRWVRGRYTPPPYDPTLKRSMEKKPKLLRDENNVEDPIIERRRDTVTPDIPKGRSMDNLTNGDLLNSIHDAIGVAGGAGGAYGERWDKGSLSHEGGGEESEELRVTADVADVVSQPTSPSSRSSGSGSRFRNWVLATEGRNGAVPFDSSVLSPQSQELLPKENGADFGLEPQLEKPLAPVEDRLRAYGYYKSLDPSLSWETFDARELTVPPPEIGDEGLGEEEFRRRYLVHPFVDTRRDALSTFGMDVDRASYRRALGQLRSGVWPQPDSVRTEGFINSYPVDCPTDPEEVFNVLPEGGPSPFGREPSGKSLDLLKITLKARELRPGERKSAVLTLVVDTSGSMAASAAAGAADTTSAGVDLSAESRLELVRGALRKLVEALDSQDRVGIVAYSTHPYLVLPHTPARERTRILGAIDSLRPSGATNVEAGLDLAYRVADEVFDPKALNRIILCSDGVANVGARGPEEILKKVEVFAHRGMFLSSVGFGMGKYNDLMMETLAKRGNGNYAYLDSLQEAEKIFQHDLPSTLHVLAKDAKIQVEFNPDVVSHYRLLGYEVRTLRDEDFRNDSVDAGEVGPGSTVTVLYELQRHAQGRGDLGKIYLRYRDAETERVQERNYPLKQGVLATRLEDTTDELRFVAALAESAELLRDSYWSRDGSWAKVIELLGGLSPGFQARAELRELLELALRAQELVVQGTSGGI